MDDIIFLMQYMATHLVNGDTQFEDPFVYHLKIASVNFFLLFLERAYRKFIVVS